MERKYLVFIFVQINYPLCFGMTRGIEKVFCSLIHVNSSITTKENLSGIYEASKDVATQKGDSGQNIHQFYRNVVLVRRCTNSLFRNISSILSKEWDLLPCSFGHE